MIAAPLISLVAAVSTSTVGFGALQPTTQAASTEEVITLAPSDPLIQYGVAFTVEQVLSAGPICVDPCILSSGGGITVRVGQRTPGPFYFGLAYELSKQGSNNIYRLGILQQLRGEGRYYIETGRRTLPFLQFGGGVAGYGNEWSIETRGPLVYGGAGAQFQIARDTVVGVGLAYRAILLSGFTDTAGAKREGGIASIIGFDLQLEALDLWPSVRRKRH